MPASNIFCMREVKWLWYPYIPFGKLTIIQGDPGEGKTTFALRLAARLLHRQTDAGNGIALTLQRDLPIGRGRLGGYHQAPSHRSPVPIRKESSISERTKDRSIRRTAESKKAIMQCDAKLLIQESVAITYPFEEQPDSTRQIHTMRAHTRCSLYGNFSQEKKAQNQIYLNMKRDRLHCKRSLIIKDLFRQTGIYHIVYFIGSKPYSIYFLLIRLRLKSYMKIKWLTIW